MFARCIVSFFAVVLAGLPVVAQQSGSVSAIQSEIAEKLLKVRRIYVESFGDDQQSKVLYAMLVSSLSNTGRFIVTENKEKADAILKGASIEKTSQELHSSSETTSVAGAAGQHSGSVTGTRDHVSGSSSGGFVAHAAGIGDSVTSTETIDRAAAAVRLIHSDGDLIWATTQESKGAKYKGASADVADKIVKQLLRDLEKLEKGDATKKVP